MAIQLCSIRGMYLKLFQRHYEIKLRHNLQERVLFIFSRTSVDVLLCGTGFR